MAITVALAWVAISAGLWPVLPTSHRGLSPSLAWLAAIVVIGVTFALFAVALVLTFRWMYGGRRQKEPAGDASPITRRVVLAGGVGAGLAVATATAGVGNTLFRQATFSYDGMQVNGPGITPITPNETFYVVTKNVIDPRVHTPVWRLSIGGAVARPRTLAFDDLCALPSVTQEITLTCISNAIGGGLQSNAMWWACRCAT